jgi:hypothetical protein
MTIDALSPSGPRNVFLGGSVSARIDWPDSTAGIGAVTPRRAASLAQPGVSKVLGSNKVELNTCKPDYPVNAARSATGLLL